MAPLLEARSIFRHHSPSNIFLLEDVSLGISAGECVALAGPSGSGKTVLLRALALLDPLDRGKILFQDRPAGYPSVPRYRCHVAYLHQRPSLFAETVEEALRIPFSLALHRDKKFKREKIGKWLDRLGFSEDFLQKSVLTLSGGESQVTALLRLLQLDPQILLLDEPTAALDPRTATAVEGFLDDWLRDDMANRAILWVSHQADQAHRVATRFLTMQSGRLS